MVQVYFAESIDVLQREQGNCPAIHDPENRLSSWAGWPTTRLRDFLVSKIRKLTGGLRFCRSWTKEHDL